jgi:hypothetical protein
MHANRHNTLSFTYDALGRMLSAGDQFASYAYAYDRLGRMTISDAAIAGLAPTVTLTNAYDAAGRRTQVAATIGGNADFVTNYMFDQLGRTTSIRQYALHVDADLRDAIPPASEMPDHVGSPASEMLDHVGSPALEMLDHVGSPASEMPGYVGSPASEMPDHVGSPASEMLGYVGSPASEMPGYVGSPASEMPDHVGSPASEMLDHVGSPALEMLDHVGSPASEMPGYVGSPASEMPGYVGSPASEMPGYVGSPASEMPDHVGSPASEMLDHVGSPASEMLGYVGSPASEMPGYVGSPASEMPGYVDTLPVADKRVDFTYDLASQPVTLTRYADLSGNQVVAATDYLFDQAGRLTGMTHSKGASIFADYDWMFDEANGMTRFESLIDGVADYTNDDTGQLTGAEYTAGAGLPTAPPDEQYVYDENGNRLNNGYTVGPNNQLLSDGTHTYTYDEEGNRTSKTHIATGEVTEYHWDHRNRLTNVTFKDGFGVATKIVEHAYDDSRRVVTYFRACPATSAAFSRSGCRGALHDEVPQIPSILRVKSTFATCQSRRHVGRDLRDRHRRLGDPPPRDAGIAGIAAATGQSWPCPRR